MSSTIGSATTPGLLTSTSGTSTSGTSTSGSSGTSGSSAASGTSSPLTSTTNTGTVSSLGVGSGLDLSGLLTQLVNAEKAPQQAIINQQTATANANISALGTLQSALTTFQSALANLKDASDYNAKTATSSDTSAFSATAVTTADVGNYNIGIVSVAQANKIASANFASQTTTVGDGTLTIGVGSSSFDVAITAGVNDTVAGIRDAINNAPGNTGVKASLLTVSDGAGGTAVKLVLTSTNTGAANQISVSVADSDGTNTDNTGLSQLYYLKSDTKNSQLSQVNAAQDASITVDGFPATSSTNTFSSTIPGVTITALQASADPLNPTTAQLTIANDTSSIAQSVQTFVTAYNTLIGTFNQLATYNPTTQVAGPLFGDSSVALIQSQINKAIYSPVTGAAPTLNTLAQIGITTNADGTLSFDANLFGSATNNGSDATDLGTLFSGANGIAGQLDNLITQVTGSGGVLSTDQQKYTTLLSQLSDQQTALNARIATFQATYQAQFAALDQIVQQLNQTSSFLTQQFDAINNTGSSSSKSS